MCQGDDIADVSVEAAGDEQYEKVKCLITDTSTVSSFSISFFPSVRAINVEWLLSKAYCCGALSECKTDNVMRLLSNATLYYCHVCTPVNSLAKCIVCSNL